jgi:chemotaxis protein MotB
MARDKRKRPPKPGSAWLITFSDMMTLLLTFFVLLLSMSSMDRSFLTRFNIYTADIGLLTYERAGQVPSRIRLVVELFERPLDVLHKKQRIKDLLFPDDVLPPEIDRSTLEKNLEILQRDEGVALVLNDGLLFEPGGYELTPAARVVLEQVGQVIEFMPAPVNVSGHADNSPSASVSNLELSARRALAVFDELLEQGHSEQRLSLSAYGATRPIADNATEEGRARNRRVEILLKTTPLFESVPFNEPKETGRG